MSSLWVNCSAVQGNKQEERSLNVRVEEETLDTTGAVGLEGLVLRSGGGTANILQRRKLKPRGLFPRAAYPEGQGSHCTVLQGYVEVLPGQRVKREKRER